jgi:hypothetical protein
LERVAKRSLRLELRRRLGTEETEVEPKQLEYLPDFQKKRSWWMEATERRDVLAGGDCTASTKIS